MTTIAESPDVDTDQPVQRRAWSVGAHLLLILVVAAVALVGAAGYGFVWSQAQLRSHAVEDLEYAAARAAGDVTSALAPLEQTVSAVAAGVKVQDLFQRADDCTLTASGSGPFPALRIDILDAQGGALCSSDPARLSGSESSEAPQWISQVLAAEGPLILQPVTDPLDNSTALLVGMGLRDGATPVAAVVVMVALEPVAAGLARQWAGPDESSFTVIDPANGVIRSTSVAPGRAGESVESTGFAAGARSGSWTGLAGTERLFASAEVPVTGWLIYAGAPDSTIVAGARSELLREGFVAVAALLLLSVAGWTVHRRITRPLRKVSRAVVAAGAGLSERPVTVSGPAEIAALAHQFNAMLAARAGHEAQLLEQALHDPLTGLPNRRLLHERLSHALSARTDRLVTVLFLDIDRFKLLNDSHGHDVGDRILISVAERLQSALRTGDTLARFGGDEYVVLCDTLHDPQHAVSLAQRLRACLIEPVAYQGTEVVLSASIGIAVGQPGEAGADDLIREADTAMYRAKQSGSGWSMFDESQREAAIHRLGTEAALEHAIDRDELRVHYQPILDLERGEIVGAEALVRWEHPERGLVPPMEFIPVAEETGQIVKIGDHVLRQACLQAAAWNAAGHRIRVSVNLAAAQLLRGDLHGEVRALLQETNLDPAQLCLEITETTLVKASGPGTRALEQLSELGVAIAVDDFGTGYSSLSYLREFPVTELKIDRAFISRLGASARDDSLVEAIVRMAQALGLSVVAEGVETRDQSDILVRLGCDLAQGYLFSKPMPAGAVTALLPTGAVPLAAGA